MSAYDSLAEFYDQLTLDVDYEKFAELVEFQMANKIDALVVCGKDNSIYNRNFKYLALFGGNLYIIAYLEGLEQQ